MEYSAWLIMTEWLTPHDSHTHRTAAAETADEHLPKWRGQSRAPIKWFPRVTGLWVRLVFYLLFLLFPVFNIDTRAFPFTEGFILGAQGGDARGRQLPRCKSEVESPSAFTPAVPHISGGNPPALTHSSRYSSHQKYTVVPPCFLACLPTCLLTKVHIVFVPSGQPIQNSGFNRVINRSYMFLGIAARRLLQKMVC